MSSIRLKKFHCQGGSAYALYPKTDLTSAVSFIVSLQTISDYLDNLCDRMGIQDEAAFRQLHLSMHDAVDPDGSLNDYYSLFPHKADNGYLKSLVENCREQAGKLPSYNYVAHYIKKYISLYCDLQSFKHLPIGTRESRLVSWADEHLKNYPGLTWWEFSAASGSTLGVFMMFSAASDPNLEPSHIKALDAAYFPWICGLHILLDYYIDSLEDIETGDLNFTSFYESKEECKERISYFVRRSNNECLKLPYEDFHRTIINGLLAMYLSDPKAYEQSTGKTSREILKLASFKALFYHKICKLLRAAGKL